MGRRKPVRDGFLTWLGKLLLGAGRVLPWSAGYFTGGLIGRLTYMFSGRERDKALKSIAIAFDGELDGRQQKKLALSSFKHMGRILFEFIKLPGLKGGKALRRVVVADQAILQKMQKADTGIIIATGHLGNWEIMGAAAAQLGFSLNVIAREIHISGFNRMVIDLRSSAGIKTIVRNSESSAKQILSALRSNGMLAMLIDQDIAAEGEFVPFFGRQALTPTGAARLAKKTDSMLVAACCHRTGPGRFQLKLREIRFDSSLGDDESVLKATAEATQILEGWIREVPDQWPWIHQRWKTRPAEELHNQ